MIQLGRMQVGERAKHWIGRILIFVLVQLIFLLIDGTSWEPNINDSNNFLIRMGRSLLDSKLYTEWMAPYSFPFFNLITTILLANNIIQAVRDLFSAGSSKIK